MVLEDFPREHGQERDDAIINAIANNRHSFSFSQITSEHNGKTAIFFIFSDAFKIDGVRVNVSANLMQKLADSFECILPTSKLYDLAWHQASTRIQPFPRPITSSTDAMIEHSQKIDTALENAGYTEGLVSTVGKVWVLDNMLSKKPGMACNYGWHFSGGNSYQGISGDVNSSLLKSPSGMYWYMIQSRGYHHDKTHDDYSQVCVLVSKKCYVDNQEMNICDLLQDPELAHLANVDGVLNSLTV
jgi:hypothetical protein